jgi:hypothetical protein
MRPPSSLLRRLEQRLPEDDDAVDQITDFSMEGIGVILL